MSATRWDLFKTVVDRMAVDIHGTARNKGWWDPRKHNGVYVQRTFPEILALIHSEVSEALESWRDGHDYNELYYSCPHQSVIGKDQPCAANPECQDRKPEGIPAELADIIIRTLDAARFYGIDVSDALVKKVEYNNTRPYRHGGKRA